MKTMSGISDLRRWRLVHHTPLEGVVLAFHYASCAGSLAALWRVGVVVFIYVACLCSLDISPPWVAGAVTTSVDALPSLCWRMLCRSCVDHSGGYFAGCFGVVVALLILSCGCFAAVPCSLVVSGGCFAVVVLLLLVDTWPPSCCFVISIYGLGGGVLCVGSHVLVVRIGSTGCVGFSFRSMVVV